MSLVELDDVELRILGCLAEKAVTTPDNYPLSTNALVNACNQTSNREPVMDISEREVDQAMLNLRTAGLARTVTGGRANKHRHVVDEAWGLAAGELAVLAVLFLRGAQTTGELSGRAERMHTFDDLSGVEAALASLEARSDPFVRQLERLPGQKERRWVHLCGSSESSAAAPVTPTPGTAPQPVFPPPSPPSPVVDERDVDALRAEVARLRRDVDRLYDLLGEERES
ncbi:MAG: YceH family protein [Actinomycetota bacterium]